MAPIKRKSESVAQEATPPGKKHKPSSTAKTSILRVEEPAFPRGGASILTPLEYKQIQIQAKQDVLFEQTTGKKVARNEFGDEEDAENIQGEPNELVRKSRKRKSPNPKKGSKNGMIEEAVVRIEGLSYKVGN